MAEFLGIGHMIVTYYTVWWRLWDKIYSSLVGANGTVHPSASRHDFRSFDTVSPVLLRFGGVIGQAPTFIVRLWLGEVSSKMIHYFHSASLSLEFG